MSSADFSRLLAEATRIARDVAAAHAAEVDRDARFPVETVAALREARLLSAPLAPMFGGAGCGVFELGQLVAALAPACASSAMVLAMHLIQAACLARHAPRDGFFGEFQRGLAAHQWLLASMTSEVGTFGDTRSSVCALQAGDGMDARFTLVKQATTGSYCAHADAILVTTRKTPDSAPGDQALVLVRREDFRLAQTGGWDTLGMRGTCSPGFRLEAGGERAQVLPDDYAAISARSMVPFSHILWAALWTGIAAGAQAKAAAFVRQQARQNPGTTPPTALRLAELGVEMQALRQHWQSVAHEFDALPDVGAAELGRMGWALKLNQLKIAASEQAPRIVHRALQIVGILGYKNDGPFSIGREYRDVLSGALMVSNDRIAAQDAAMWMVFKDEPA